MKEWNQKWFLSPLFRGVLDTLPAGSSYLDLGCGGGRVALYLWGTKDSKVYGLDRDAAQIEELRTLHPEIQWICGEASECLRGFDVRWVVSNVCIRKDQCRLEETINDQSDYVLRVANCSVQS